MPESRAGYTEPPTQSMKRNRHHFTQLCHSGSSTPRLNVGVFSKRKGVCYHRDGQVHSCRFCEILRTTAEPFLYQDEHIVVFRPLRPIVPSHVLIVPRAHIRNVNRLAAKHRGLLARMHHVATTFMTGGFETETEAECVGLQPQELKDFHGHRVHYTFHVPPFNSIDHVHMHAFLDDPCTLGYYGRLKYRTTSWWCRSYDQVMARLEKLAVDVQNECVRTDEETPSPAGPPFSPEQA
uniref:HIT domain-containing protein n=1 Tax=Peronospora matthiolae TaxID=2874970 RepID=A0AAV1U453_9STRA